MDYESLRAFSGTLGLIIFVSLFAGVLVYALWPRNKSKFDHAAHIPLNDDDDINDDVKDEKLTRGGCRG